MRLDTNTRSSEQALGIRNLLHDNISTLFVCSLIFCIGVALFWASAEENMKEFVKYIEYLACILCGASLGYRKEYGDGSPLSLIYDTASVSWRVSLMWLLLAATVESLFVSESIYTATNFSPNGNTAVSIRWTLLHSRKLGPGSDRGPDQEA